MVETGGLENRCTGNRTGGSNPSPSAIAILPVPTPEHPLDIPIELARRWLYKGAAFKRPFFRTLYLCLSGFRCVLRNVLRLGFDGSMTR